MKHLFLSPHIDDVVFSCGGFVHQLSGRDEQVEVLTVNAGDPPPTLPDSPIVRELHQRWNRGENPYIARRIEDEHACRAVGAQAFHMGLQDCIYRTVNGEALYPTGVFGDVHPDDPQSDILAQTPSPITDVDVLYIPLGVGHHVDHQLVRDWGMKLAAQGVGREVVFYEEYPYIRVDGAVEKALEFFAPQTLTVDTISMSEADVAAKVNASQQYESQISSFWADADALAVEIREIMTRFGGPPVERFWKK
ncbi:MAG: PIG-L family deacetylase [Burkholderiales bacterium]|nr:PIG-L family deacetylase [Anaerolineae bacterium]